MNADPITHDNRNIEFPVQRSKKKSGGRCGFIQAGLCKSAVCFVTAWIILIASIYILAVRIDDYFIDPG
jgi:hypothetical protein